MGGLGQHFVGNLASFWALPRADIARLSAAGSISCWYVPQSDQRITIWGEMHDSWGHCPHCAEDRLCRSVEEVVMGAAPSAPLVVLTETMMRVPADFHMQSLLTSIARAVRPCRVERIRGFQCVQEGLIDRGPAARPGVAVALDIRHAFGWDAMGCRLPDMSRSRAAPIWKLLQWSCDAKRGVAAPPVDLSAIATPDEFRACLALMYRQYAKVAWQLRSRWWSDPRRPSARAVVRLVDAHAKWLIDNVYREGCDWAFAALTGADRRSDELAAVALFAGLLDFAIVAFLRNLDTSPRGTVVHIVCGYGHTFGVHALLDRGALRGARNLLQHPRNSEMPNCLQVRDFSAGPVGWQRADYS